MTAANETGGTGTMSAGIVLRIDGALAFVPADVALKVVLVPKITRVAGAPPELLGIALHEGQSVPVVSIGAARKTMVICMHAGEPIGLVGGEVVSAGLLGEHEVSKPLDIGAIYARLQASSWTAALGATSTR